MSHYDDELPVEVATPPATRRLLALWASVFHRGILDAAIQLRDYTRWNENERNGARPATDALDWMADTRKSPGSFLWLCDLFGYDPDQARSNIRLSQRTLLAAAGKDAR